jgi:glycosyltransferase involved in cell wall biosynthesis
LKKIIITLPCYNEEDTLQKLADELSKVRSKISKQYAIDVLFINDGSTDKTQKIIESLAKKNDFLFYREFAANAGHQAALRAGIEAGINYDAVIMMDADLQHPPEYISTMLEIWNKQSVNIVQMIRDDTRQEAGTVKYITSKGYYWFINKLSGLNLEYGASDFRLIDQVVTKEVVGSTEKDLFLRGYFSWIKASRVTVPYKPAQRFAGSSKYTFKKMLQFAGKGILQFSEKPLRLAVGLGIIMALLSLLYGIFLIVSYLIGDYAVSGWTSLMSVLLFCFGVNFIVLGLIGIYLSHAIAIGKKRPQYIIATEKLSKD